MVRKYYDATRPDRIRKMGNPYMGPEMTSHMIAGTRVLVSRLVPLEKKRIFLDYLEARANGQRGFEPGQWLSCFGHVPREGRVEQIYVLSSRDGHEYLEETRLPRPDHSPKWFIRPGEPAEGKFYEV